jgi:Arm domain-containing DNA-binding protein
MKKIQKRAIDALQADPDRDVFAWDNEIRGFGIRVKPSGVKTYLVQYRNADGRTRRLVLGQHGALTPKVARDWHARSWPLRRLARTLQPSAMRLARA